MTQRWCGYRNAYISAKTIRYPLIRPKARFFFLLQCGEYQFVYFKNLYNAADVMRCGLVFTLCLQGLIDFVYVWTLRSPDIFYSSISKLTVAWYLFCLWMYHIQRRTPKSFSTCVPIHIYLLMQAVCLTWRGSVFSLWMCIIILDVP